MKRRVYLRVDCALTMPGGTQALDTTRELSGYSALPGHRNRPNSAAQARSLGIVSGYSCPLYPAIRGAEKKKAPSFEALEGAGYRVRTGDIQLGKLTLYQLS